jgi:threonine dehydratase
MQAFGVEDIRVSGLIMIDEAVEQLPKTETLTHVFAQAGVGSIPATIYMGLLKHWTSPDSVESVLLFL